MILGKRKESQFRKFFEKGEPPHAFLLLGGQAARREAEELLVKFLSCQSKNWCKQCPSCCNKIKLDFHLYEKPFLGLEEAHEIAAWAQKSSFGEAKIFILKSRLFGREAEAALLKLVEEPPAATYFVVSAFSENVFSPPFLSRFAVFRTETGPDESEREFLKKYAGGEVQKELLQAAAFAKNSEKAEEFLRIMELWFRVQIKKRRAEELKALALLLEDFFESKKRAAAKTYRPAMLLEHFIISKSYLEISN